MTFKRISFDDHIFGSQTKTGWRVSHAGNNKAKLLISKEWVDRFFQQKTSLQTSTIIEEPTTINKIQSMIEDVPPLLVLENQEKFKGRDGKVLDIEFRGERDEDFCFIRVKDVAVAFYDVGLCKNIDRADQTQTSYRLKEHFFYLYRPSEREPTKKEKKIFFTFQGMLKFLFISQNPNAKDFRKWATRILFVHQLGTPDQKENMVSDLLGVPPETVQRFLSACVKDLPIVYMIHLGSVPDEIECIGDPNDYVFVKIGQHGI